MRAFQPIAGRTRPKPRRTPWIAPPDLRRVAGLIASTVILFQFVLLFRLLYYPVGVQNHSTFGIAHFRFSWYIEFPLLLLQFCCAPIIAARPPRLKHIPDPALSITPR